MSDQKNLVIAIALSLVILLGWQYFYAQTQTPEEVSQQQQQPGQPAADASKSPVPTGAGSAEIAPTVPGAQPAPKSVLAVREEALAKTARLPIRSPRLEGSIALLSGRIDDLSLKGYKETLDPDSRDIILLSPSGSSKPYYARYGWSPVGAKVKTPDDTSLWVADRKVLTPDRPVTLRWDNGAGLIFSRRIALDDNYMFTITQKVENKGASAVTMHPYGLLSRKGTTLSYTWIPSGDDIQNRRFYILHEGPLGVFDGTLVESDYEDLQEPDGTETRTSTGGWLGVTDKYWLAAMIPDQKTPFTGRFRHVKNAAGEDRFQIDFLSNTALTAAPGASIEATSRLFAGAKEVALLEHYRDDTDVINFDLAVDFGLLHFLTKPLFKILDFFHRGIGNFGLSILLLTVCVKLVFFPLAQKSYKSMSRMKALAPEITRLRERFGEDKQRLNQEMMELYKKESVNPASGCLPILIQIPVFFALYKVLFVTIEMRHTPFFGWIHDLSAPDPTSMFNLFGLIPWDPPQFLMIGVWPLLMGISMFLQQKLNPSPPDPMQARIFMLMPIMFTWLLAAFPAGLVIYWTWNNLLSITQQYVIMRRMGVPIGGGKAKAKRTT